MLRFRQIWFNAGHKVSEDFSGFNRNVTATIRKMDLGEIRHENLAQRIHRFSQSFCENSIDDA